MKPASPEQALFAEALRRATPEARAAYLEAACGADTALRRRVEVLLRAAENAGDFLELPPSGLGGEADATQLVTELISEKPGDRIGRYKLLEQIGVGWSVAISPDGRRMLSGSADGATKLRSAETRQNRPGSDQRTTRLIVWRARLTGKPWAHPARAAASRYGT